MPPEQRKLEWWDEWPNRTEDSRHYCQHVAGKGGVPWAALMFPHCKTHPTRLASLPSGKIARPGRRLIRENDLGAEFFYVVESGALLIFYFSELVGWQSQVWDETG